MPTLSEDGGGGYGVAEPVLRFADGDGDADGEAALPGASEGRVGDDLGGGFRVGVGQYDDVVFCAALALHALAAGGAARVDIFGHRRGADKTDRAHQRMIEQRVDRRLAAVDQVHNAGGQAGLLNELDQPCGGERHAIAGLEHDGVARGDGVGQKPERESSAEN